MLVLIDPPRDPRTIFSRKQNQEIEKTGRWDWVVDCIVNRKSFCCVNLPMFESCLPSRKQKQFRGMHCFATAMINPVIRRNLGRTGFI